ncbi:MAG: fatty acid--CoA ligase, partial [Pseudomonadota bacterium]|nr:fatty acid--CoA ligase [Pseudomonadota bacterium]
ILVRGPQTMMGYWRLPEATDSALKGGWMHTGDAGYMDEEGFIYIQDRIKDMIVSGAENIYPAEVERAIFEHPAVADTAVVGIPDEQWGETVLAFVALKSGQTLELDTLQAFCRERLAGYKIPSKLEIIDAIPRNASGKSLKTELRQPYWEGKQRQVS